MGRSGFFLGLLTGVVCALGVFLRPQPRPAALAGVLATVAPGVYRLAGEIKRDTCGVRAAPWPDRWAVAQETLGVGGRLFHARRGRAAVVYEAVERAPQECLVASWIIKLAPTGDGFSGTAVWEVAAEPFGCTPPSGVPCSREARVVGYPDRTTP